MSGTEGSYYVPEETRQPALLAVGLAATLFGFAMSLHDNSAGSIVMMVGGAITAVTIWMWMAHVIRESEAGLNSAQMDRTYRMGMGWFIFSEVMFFAAFFGALFYVRVLVLPWLSGEGNNAMTNQLLWPLFEGLWSPLSIPSTEGFTPATGIVGAWGVPAINTALLLTSGATLTWAHWGLFKKSRGQLIAGLALTVLLGSIFMVLQVQEYAHAMNDLSLTFNSGIYGSLFYMMTGFHGAHVTLGVLMLTVILGRSIKGHFTPEHHFAFEGVAWYWHFVDVVWLILFVFIYWV
ncbi:MAG: cytochrome c oxidase subunit 3 [Immundisolibacteraceae bacterium]|nr:cytochrome c oxidase subunit 3 [Immundisolibacteraceae bacterium]